jgi:glutathione synthase/RimK-type ligase-like ATP-grasp enzyme
MQGVSPEPSRLAIVTGEFAPELSDDGKRLAESLQSRGVASDPVSWQDASVNWGAYDAVLVRSCWDYPEDPDRFRTMLDEIEGAGVPVANPLPVIRWNLHKRYVLALADAGIRIPPTVLRDEGADASLEAILADEGWDEAVVKPAVGARSAGVWRTSRRDAHASEDRFGALLADGDVLVQKFVPEITDGERSIVLFGGEYSHAWNSLLGDEVTSFDGVDAEYEPTESVREAATAAVRAASDRLDVDETAIPYARVDYAERGDRIVVMELELIEPYLGFERGENTAERFSETLCEFFRNRR